ncbi:hypothetical protein EUGRSUZ_E00262 [Eucalyptus grandis]|uniref:Uncharacterized protein n=2 Tax=Eucalyptus grandis TaxID=71139 RepID=A0ACC3KR31_EUCGR|nr:hypothetical protein EUGRSUZ_E00262 [Eucalyptus grandis]
MILFHASLHVLNNCRAALFFASAAVQSKTERPEDVLSASLGSSGKVGAQMGQGIENSRMDQESNVDRIGDQTADDPVGPMGIAPGFPQDSNSRQEFPDLLARQLVVGRDKGGYAHWFYMLLAVL